jgi:hypothetical protein
MKLKPILENRTCICGCKKKFMPKSATDPRQFFDRKCAAVFNGKHRGPASKRLIQTKSGIKGKRSAIGSESDLFTIRAAAEELSIKRRREAEEYNNQP